MFWRQPFNGLFTWGAPRFPVVDDSCVSLNKYTLIPLQSHKLLIAVLYGFTILYIYEAETFL